MRPSTLEPSLCSRQCPGLHMRVTQQTAFCREFRRAIPVCFSGGVPMGVRCDACHAAEDRRDEPLAAPQAGQLALEVTAQ